MIKACSLSVHLALAAVFALPAAAQQAAAPPPAAVTLFQNVRIFDGKSAQLSGAVERAGARQPDRADFQPRRSRLDRGAGAVVIDGGGRTLMPGLIDAHWHTMLVRPTPAAALTGDVGYINLAGRRRGDRHADARLHHRPRHGRAVVRTQARHRRGPRRRARASTRPAR